MMETNPPRPDPSVTRLLAINKYIDSLGIKYDELPQRPFWAPLFTFTHKRWKTQVAGKIWDSSMLIGRQLTQDETDALAEQYAKAIQHKPYEFPISVVVGYAFYRRTASSFKFPIGLRSGSRVDRNSFPGLGLDGSRNPAHAILSRRFWALMRLGSWLLACNLGISILMPIPSIWTYHKQFSNDPRLENYRREMRLVVEKGRQPGRQTQRSAFRPESSSEHENSTMEQYQPFSGQFPQSSQPAWTQSQLRQPQVAQTSSVDDDPFEFDDASPIAPAQETSAPQYNTQQGSAWDRLRAQAAPNQGQQGRRSPMGTWEKRVNDETTSQAAKQGTSFNFSSEDEARAYAKGQAQREFDEMLERERKGDSNART